MKIIAIGGGGFSSEFPSPRLDRFLADSTGRARPRVCLIPTASAERERRVLAFYQAAAALGVDAGHLSLFQLPSADLAGWLSEFDLIFVSGGNTRSMLALWREWAVPDALRAAGSNGTVLSGVSAGANCWFDQCSTDSNPGALSILGCLGWLPGSFTPHLNSEPERRPTLLSWLASGDLAPGWAADEQTALVFDDGKMTEAVCGLPEGSAWRAERDGLHELETRRLEGAA
jgi:peptidase E